VIFFFRLYQDEKSEAPESALLSFHPKPVLFDEDAWQQRYYPVSCRYATKARNINQSLKLQAPTQRKRITSGKARCI